jgi:hypothetical protein
VFRLAVFIDCISDKVPDIAVFVKDEIFDIWHF